MYELTKHFCERWVERIGDTVPGKEEINRLICDEPICLQNFRKAFTQRMRNLTVVAIYVIPEYGAAVKVHTKGKKLLTVMSTKYRIQRRADRDNHESTPAKL